MKKGKMDSNNPCCEGWAERKHSDCSACSFSSRSLVCDEECVMLYTCMWYEWSHLHHIV
jgi:hypothetical protein